MSDAEAMFSESLEINRHLRHVEGIAVTRMYLGRLFQERNNHDLALQHLQEALRLFRQIGNHRRVWELEERVIRATAASAEQ